MEKIELLDVENVYLDFILKDKKINFIPRQIYDRLYDYLSQEVRTEDKNKLFKYRDKITDKTFEEIIFSDDYPEYGGKIYYYK